MNRARTLPFLSSSKARRKKVATISGSSAVKYNNTRTDSIVGLRIYGDFVYNSALRMRMGVGVRGDDGSVRVAVRVHNECCLDGYEFVRVLKEKNSPLYQGEYDSDHFLYRVTEEDTELFGPLDFSPGILGYKLTLEADVPEEKADITTFGLQFISNYGSKHAATRSVTGAGPSTFSVTMSQGTLFKHMQQAAQTEAFDIPIRYDSFKLYNGSVVPERYKGYTKVFDIKEPLQYAYIDGRDTFDELDLISGKLTRRIARFIIDETTQINEASYDGVCVFAIPLPSDIKYFSMDSDVYSSVGDPYDLVEEKESFYIPDNDGNMYVFINENVVSVDEARKKLLGVVFYYQTEDRIEKIEKLEPKCDVGVVVVEACTNTSVKIEVDYYE